MTVITAKVEPDTHTRLGGMLRDLRTRHEISQLELSRRARCHTSYISRLESGSRHPDRDVLARIARAVGEDPSLLLISAGYLPDALVRQIDAGKRRPNEIRNALFRVLSLEV